MRQISGSIFFGLRPDEQPASVLAWFASIYGEWETTDEAGAQIALS